jgi:hypothetical protein
LQREGFCIVYLDVCNQYKYFSFTRRITLDNTPKLSTKKTGMYISALTVGSGEGRYMRDLNLSQGPEREFD